MRPFSVEVAQILGWHDGLRTTVRLDAVASQMVASHESVHANLFTSTPDGSLARICLWAHGQGPRAGTLGDLIGAYFETCRVAHESAATYLGIQLQMTEDQRSAGLQAFTQEYRDYYRNYAEIIDPICKSTFLRHVFGKAIAFAIFASRACVAFVESGFDLSVAIDPKFSADRRQETLFAWLRSGGMQHLQAFALDVIRTHPDLTGWAAFEQFPETSFGALDDDRHWAGALLAGEAERWLLGSLYIELCTNSPLECLNTGSPEWSQLTGQLGVYTESLGMVHVVVGQIDDGPPKFDNTDGEQMQAVMEVAAICVETGSPGNADLEVWRPGEMGRPLYVLQPDQAMFGVNFSQAGFENPATIETWSRSEAGVSMRDRDFKAFQADAWEAAMALQAVMHERDQGHGDSGLLFVVAPSPMEDVTPAQSRGLFAMLNFQFVAPDPQAAGGVRTPEEPRQLISQDECFWYAARGWANVIAGDFDQPTRIGRFEVQSDLHSGFILSLLQIAGRPGTYMKATPKVRAGTLMRYYDTRLASGAWQEMKPETDELTFQRAAFAFDSCLRNWGTV
jgi:hypothetical protein